MKVAVCSLSRFTHVAEFIDAAQLMNARHEVRYFLGPSDKSSLQLLQSRGIELVCLPLRDLEATAVSLEMAAKTRSVFELFTGYFLRYAERILPALIEELDRWRPDLILAHLRDYAGMTAAEILGVRLVTFGSHGPPHRNEPLDPPFGAGIARNAPQRDLKLMWRMQHAFDDQLDALFNERLRRPFGLKPMRGTSTCHSRTLTLLSLIPALANRNTPEPSHIRYVGPLFSRQGVAVPPDEDRLLARIADMPRPRVLLSLGTTYARPLLERCLQALSGFDGTLVASLGGGGHHLSATSAGTCRSLVSHPFFADIERLLELCDAQVTVAGGKSVMEALGRGKPMVCLPQQGEQRELALALREQGAAEVPCSRKWTDDDFASAVKRIVVEPGYSQAATRLRQQVRGMGGPALAARLVEASSMRADERRAVC